MICAVGAGLDDDVAELLLAVSRPWALTVSWKSTGSGIGGAPTRPAATCTFCSRMALDHVAGGQAARGHLLRVEPDAHGVVAGAEHAHLAHAGDARQRVLARCSVA